MAGAKKEKKHIVVFQDEEGNVLKTSFVSHEEEAIPPELPEKKGELEHHEIKFQGWDQDISCVQGNLVVKAVYKEVPKEYLVMYFHEGGKLLGTESVPYGQAASQPYHPQKPKTAEHYYIFKGWNNDLSHIEKDTMAKAVFEEKDRSFTVAFFHEDGTVLKKEEVLYGQEAHAPQSPVKQQDAVWHYIFEGWDKTFDSVKENMEVHAVFSSVYNEYNVCIYERLSESNNGLQDEQLEEKIKEKQYHYGDLIEYPKLKKKGYILAVASSKPEVYVRQILDHFGLTQYFTEIGGSEMDGRRTNKTEVIEDVLRRLNMDKHREQVIMIGDKEHDVYGARKAGLECIAVSFGYGTKEELTNAEPLKIVDSAEEIVNFFA